MGKQLTFPMLILGLLALIAVLFFVNKDDAPNETSKADEIGVDAKISELGKNRKEQTTERSEKSVNAVDTAKEDKKKADEAAKKLAAKERTERIKTQLTKKIEVAKSLESSSKALDSIGHYLTDSISSSDPLRDLKNEARSIANELITQQEASEWMLELAKSWYDSTTTSPEHVVLELWALSQVYESLGNSEQASKSIDQAIRELNSIENSETCANTGMRLSNLLAYQKNKKPAVRAIKIVEGTLDDYTVIRDINFAFIAAMAYLADDKKLAQRLFEISQEQRRNQKDVAKMVYYCRSAQLEKAQEAFDDLSPRRLKKTRQIASSYAAVAFSASQLEDEARIAIRRLTSQMIHHFYALTIK